MEESKRIRGEWMSLDLDPASCGRSAIVRRFSVGPVFAITPFNFPLNLVAHKLAPALACGTSIVLKPAPQAPLSALNLARIIYEAGALPGSLNAFLCPVGCGRSRWCRMTGSRCFPYRQRGGGMGAEAEGGEEARTAGTGRECRCGGAFGCRSRPCRGPLRLRGIRLRRADLCIAVQRIYVQRTVLDSFTEKLLERIARLHLGDPLEEATDVGPMISREAAERAESWVREAVSGGAKILAGGERDGAFFQPTVLTHTKPEMKVCREEVFAPVVTLQPYDHFEDAILGDQ